MDQKRLFNATAETRSPIAVCILGVLLAGSAVWAQVPAGAVLGRYTFYNNSFHDGYDPAITTVDFDAIDPSKQPLLHGRGPATFANWTGCTDGITGLAYDIANYGSSTDEFIFSIIGKDGNSPPTAVAPIEAAVFPEAGVSGSDRYLFTFPAGVVKNTWLKVVISGSALLVPDAHYWGNAAGDTGSTIGDAIMVDQTDEQDILDHPWPDLTLPPRPIPVDWHWNLNKDELSNLTDVALCRTHFTTLLTAVKIIDKSEPATIAARHIFYNQSFYDGNKAGIDPIPVYSSNNDDADAIDPGKQPLRPGDGMATFANWTGYDKGINGLIYDFVSSNRDPMASDFVFHNIGRDGTLPVDPNTLVVPDQFLVQDLGGIKRAILTFPNATLRNTWLQVTIGTGFGLPEEDTHWWGNALADTGEGNYPPHILINATDEIAIRNHPGTILMPVYVTVPYDVNKSRTVDATDQILARNNGTTVFTCVKMISR